MPMYSYKCENCGTKYDIFHKVREETENIICPNCNSLAYKKLMTAASIGSSAKTSVPSGSLPPCAYGACDSGSCNMN